MGCLLYLQFGCSDPRLTRRGGSWDSLVWLGRGSVEGRWHRQLPWPSSCSSSVNHLFPGSQWLALRRPQCLEIQSHWNKHYRPFVSTCSCRLSCLCCFILLSSVSPFFLAWAMTSAALLLITLVTYRGQLVWLATVTERLTASASTWRREKTPCSSTSSDKTHLLFKD